MVRDIKNRIRCAGSQGFTLFELMVVVSIMSVLVVLAGGSLSTVTNSRALAASKKISALLSQSKVSALSGVSNTFELEYDADEGCYVCTITNQDGKVTTEKFGNEQLTVYVTENPDVDGNGTKHNLVDSHGASAGKLTVEFDMKSGKITRCTFGASDLNNNICNAITAQSRGTYTFRLYKATGSQVTDY